MGGGHFGSDCHRQLEMMPAFGRPSDLAQHDREVEAGLERGRCRPERGAVTIDRVGPPAEIAKNVAEIALGLGEVRRERRRLPEGFRRLAEAALHGEADAERVVESRVLRAAAEKAPGGLFHRPEVAARLKLGQEGYVHVGRSSNSRRKETGLRRKQAAIEGRGPATRRRSPPRERRRR